MKGWRLLLACVLLLGPASLAHSAGSEQTHDTLPQSGASFLPNLQAFLKQEDAKRYQEQFSSMVTSGGTHSTVGALTATPADMVAYPGGYYTTQVGGSVTYNANDTCWVVTHKDLSGNVGTFTRSAGTHYLVDCASGTKPTLPSNSAWLMEVTTNGTSVTGVTDLRSRVPDMPVYLQAELPAAGTRGRTAFVTNYNNGTIFWDTGTTWATVAANPMTAQGDLVVGGAGGVPTRLAKGTANQLLGMDNSATTEEFKTLAAGSGISVSCGTGLCTVTQTVFPPAGSLTLYSGNSPPSGWLTCDGSAVLANTYPNMALVLIPNASTWGRGVKVGDFTCDASTDICTLSSHGLVDTQIVHVATTTTLPAGLTANTVLYIRDSTLSTFKLTLTSGGTAIDITSAGSGIHSIYDKIAVPDFRGRLPMGSGTGAGLTTRTLGQTGGGENFTGITDSHVLTIAEMPSHDHSGNVFTNGAGGADIQRYGAATVFNNTPGSVRVIPQGGDGGHTHTITTQPSLDPFLVMTYIIKT